MIAIFRIQPLLTRGASRPTCTTHVWFPASILSTNDCSNTSHPFLPTFPANTQFLCAPNSLKHCDNADFGDFSHTSRRTERGNEKKRRNWGKGDAQPEQSQSRPPSPHNFSLSPPFRFSSGRDFSTCLLNSCRQRGEFSPQAIPPRGFDE